MDKKKMIGLIAVGIVSIVAALWHVDLKPYVAAVCESVQSQGQAQ